MFRIAVFTASLSHDTVRTITHVLADQPDAQVQVLIHVPRRSLGRLARNQLRNLRRHGWRWLPYQATHVASRVAERRAPKRHTMRVIAGAETAEALRRHPRVRLSAVASLNDPQTIAQLREWQPDLGLSLGAPILKPPIFELPRLGTLNIHKGRLPDYRGMPPAFWELWNGEKEVGITVHRVDAGLDSGDMLLEDRVPIERFSTPAGLRVRLDELGVQMIVEAVRLMRSGNARFRPQSGPGRTYSRPTLAQERQLLARTAPPSARRILRRAAYRGYATLGRHTPHFRDKIVVLLYHRVSDAFRDTVTVGVQQFDEHVRYLSDHYRIVPLESLISGEPLPEDGPLLAITFDDGYLDNYEHAAPILEKHGVPATFFVSTDNVGANKPFEHDLQNLGRGLPNMSWDQIRTMRAAGFAFGSHTANHINLARTDEATVATELARSREALMRELGLTHPMFAYPFGRRCDITPQRLEQVRAAGYACNCSAYGGINDRRVDPWDIRRQGVDYRFDLPTLDARIAGWRARQYG